MRLFRKDTRCELLGRHLEAEEADDCPVHRLLGAVLLRGGPEGFGNIESDVGGKRRLSHRGTSRQHDQIGVLQAAHHAVEIDQARGKAGQPAISLIGAGGHFDGVGRGVAERHEAGTIFALVGKIEEANSAASIWASGGASTGES